MAFAKRNIKFGRRFKRKFMAKRKYVKKVLKVYRVPKNKQVHFHVRRINTIKEGDWNVDTSSGLGAFYRGLSFRISDLQDYTELTHLYDQYTITKVILDFQWTLTTTSGNGPNASYSPQLNFVRDYDDDTTPDSNYMRSSGRIIRHRLTANNPFRIAITPAVSNTVYQSITTNGYGPKWKQRIDCADVDVPHYGAKIQILCPPANVGYIQITAKYYVSMFQTR